jgi:quercetin dioxygenase-like cupin family protein
LRPHPARRFAARERKIDLSECYEQLLGEDHEPVDGHRQYTLGHRGALTVILYHFNEGSRIPEHVVQGEVTIHVLEGELEVATAEQVHRLRGDQLLILEAGVEHDVHALAETRMLLTVQLNHRLSGQNSN